MGVEVTMLTTVEAEIDTTGKVELLEPVLVKKRSRAILTILDEPNGSHKKLGNGAALLALLRSPEFQNRKVYSDEEIDRQIEENRNSRD